jgi:hypothetical protein
MALQQQQSSISCGASFDEYDVTCGAACGHYVRVCHAVCHTLNLGRDVRGVSQVALQVAQVSNTTS